MDVLDLKAGDRVEHVRCGTGKITEIKAEVVYVSFDKGKQLMGAYDKRWFELHPNWLVRI